MLDFETLDYNDEKTWDLICSGKTVGVFQLESHLGREWSSKMKPRNIPELADVISTIRPGVLEVKEGNKTMTEIFQERKCGISPAVPIHHLLEPILASTHQVLCVDEDTYVSMSDGSEKHIKNLLKHDKINSLNLDNKKIEFDECYDVVPSRKEDGYELYLKNGYRVILTHDHKVLTLRGWVELSQLDIAIDKIAVVIEYYSITNLGSELEDIAWIDIDSIQNVGKRQFYSISVTNNHNFIGNGIVLKNCYQEQIMAIANKIAGFSLEETDILRRGLGKKNAQLIASIRESFVSGCIKTSNLTDEEANHIFDIIEKSARYSFNLCCSGNTKLFRYKDKYGTSLTVQEMFNIKNNIDYAKSTGHYNLYKKFKRLGYGKTLSMFEDGRIRENKIVDIRHQGKQTVYRITLENNSYIETTDNHKYPTPNGTKQLCELKIGDILFIKNERTVEDIRLFSKTYKYSNISQNELRLRKITNKGHCGFANGKQNPGYTNGSYSEFIKNKKNLLQYCNDCGPRDTPYSRLETHHIDGNRENSNIANLVNLCPSCHKKREYSIGRTKRGEIGYPSTTSKIISIEKTGETDVYDVEMMGPNHNFVTDTGIVTCNSHAIGYAKISYATAWEKAHKPLKFYCEWLSDCKHRVNGKMELRQLINDAKGFGIKIKGPNLSHIEEEFYIHDDTIYFGLANIKNIGTATAKPFLESLTTLEKPIEQFSWFELMSTVLENADIATSIGLISTGAIPGSRTHMLYEFKTWKSLNDRERAWIIGKKGSEPFENLEKSIESLLNSKYSRRQKKVEELLHLLKNPPHGLKDSNDWIVKTEQELLGFPISIDRLEQSRIPDTTCQEVHDGKTGEMTIGVEVQRVKEHTIKGGKNIGNKMAFIGVTDGTELDCIAFSDVWQEDGHMLYEGNCVALTISLSDKGGFIIQKVYQL